MGLKINAWMEAEQQFCLNILNVETGKTELQWSFDPTLHTANSDRKAVKQLFHQLLLLSCKSQLGESTTATAPL